LTRQHPTDPEGFFGLGMALLHAARPAEAAEAFREATRLSPGYAEAHCNRGHALVWAGRFADGQEALRSGHWLGSQSPAWRYPSDRWVDDARQLAEFAPRVPDLIAGRDRLGSNEELLELAYLCVRVKGYQAEGAMLFERAFAEEPRAAESLDPDHRYLAACGAARASEVGSGLDAATRARWRWRALHWLRDDLAARARALDSGDSDGRRHVAPLTRWQNDTALAGVRDKEALGRMTDSERAACRRLWAEVAALLARAGSGK
jgi:hypothetical protein